MFVKFTSLKHLFNFKYFKKKQKNWKNEPFIEICPITKIPIRPFYAKIQYIQDSIRKNSILKN